jgi:hypothetical protein
MRFVYHIAREIQGDYKSIRESCLRTKARKTDSKRFARPCLPRADLSGYLLDGVLHARTQEMDPDGPTLAHDAFAHFFDTWNGQSADVLHPVITLCKGFFKPLRMPGASLPQLSRRVVNEILCLPGVGQLQLGPDQILWDGPFGLMGMDGRVIRYGEETKTVRSLHWGKRIYTDLPTRPLTSTSTVLSRVHTLQARLGDTPPDTLELLHSILAHTPSEWNRAEQIIHGKAHDDFID